MITIEDLKNARENMDHQIHKERILIVSEIQLDVMQKQGEHIDYKNNTINGIKYVIYEPIRIR